MPATFARSTQARRDTPGAGGPITGGASRCARRRRQARCDGILPLTPCVYLGFGAADVWRTASAAAPAGSSGGRRRVGPGSAPPMAGATWNCPAQEGVGRQLITVELEAHLVLGARPSRWPYDTPRMGIDTRELEVPRLLMEIDEGDAHGNRTPARTLRALTARQNGRDHRTENPGVGSSTLPLSTISFRSTNARIPRRARRSVTSGHPESLRWVVTRWDGVWLRTGPRWTDAEKERR